MKFRFVILYLFLVLPLGLIAQEASFSLDNSVSVQNGEMHSFISPEGNLIHWSSPYTYFTDSYTYSNRLHKIRNGQKDTSSRAIYVKVNGHKDSPAYDFVAFNGKLFALAQFKTGKQDATVYACEIDPDACEPIGKPIPVFQSSGPALNYKYASALVGDTTTSLLNLPLVKVSENGLYLTLRNFYRTKLTGMPKQHVTLYKSDFASRVWDTIFGDPDNAYSFVPNDIQISNSGSVIVTGIAELEVKYARQLNIKAQRGFYVVTLGEKIEYKLIHLGQISACGMFARFSADGHIVCAGTYTKMMGRAQGVFYYAFWPNKSKPDVITVNGYPVNEAGEDVKIPVDMSHQFVQDMQLDKEGNAWLICQYHFGVNNGDKWGEFLVTAFDSTGKEVTQQVLPYEWKTVYNQIAASMTNYTGGCWRDFFALTSTDGLQMILLTQSPLSSCSATGSGVSNDCLVSIKVSTQGKITNTCIKEFGMNDILPVKYLMYPACISPGKYLILCRKPVKKPVYCSGTVELN